jgi:hypothetical protein
MFGSMLGYNNYNGLAYGLETSFAHKIDPHWQILLGGSFESSLHNPPDMFGVSTGVRYNFGSDFSRAYFASVGIEYGNKNPAHLNGWNWHAEVGKRFRLNDSGTWTYMPHVSISSNGKDQAQIRIQPLAFTYSF